MQNIALLLFAYFSVVCPAQAKTSLNWFIVDIPPVYIIEEGKPVGGYGEESMRFVMDKLPQYEHSVDTMNLSRGLNHLREGKHTSFSTLLKNSERDKFIEFSIPAQLVLPLHLIVREEAFPAIQQYVDENGEVDLNRMLVAGKNSLGIASGRSYSHLIDEILAKHEGHPNIYFRSSMNVSSGLLHMLQIGRLDCILEFPVTVGFILKKGYKDHSDPHKKLISLPIKGMPHFFKTHFAAPKSDWGKILIKRINEILRKHRTSDEFIEFYGAWLSGATRERYIQTVRDVLADE